MSLPADGVARWEGVIAEEMREWGIGGVAVALVDDQRVVYAGGFGEAVRDSVFRVGSISKLFTAVAVMREVEAGRLDLDAAVPPDLLPLNPFPGRPPVSLRQILAHRSGLQRESPVGGYYDDSQPGLAATVESARGCALVTAPGEKTRYSNLGPSMAGRMVELSSGRRFEDYQRVFLLGPMGMADSAWTLENAARERLPAARMRVADGQGGWARRPAPLFNLGTIPAGNLFSTVEDLGRFASALFAGGGEVISERTLEEMWRPQFTGEPTGFGLGFLAGWFQGERTIGHNGAVYGHSACFLALPGRKLAVVALANEDIVNGRMRRISEEGLSFLLEAKTGVRAAAPSAAAASVTFDPGVFEGEYESQSFWARLEAREGRLEGNISGQPTKFLATGNLAFTAHSRLEEATPVVFERDGAGGMKGFKMGAQQFERVPARPAGLPAAWRDHLGAHGPDFIPLVVSERHGHLYAMTENMADYRLTPVNGNVCLLPPGLYTDEQAVFLTGPDGGPPHSVNFANMILRRHHRGGKNESLRTPCN